MVSQSSSFYVCYTTGFFLSEYLSTDPPLGKLTPLFPTQGRNFFGLCCCRRLWPELPAAAASDPAEDEDLLPIHGEYWSLGAERFPVQGE